MQAVKRTHDKFYLLEDRYKKPKEIFKLLGAIASAQGQLSSGKRVADFGCATGEFVYYLKETFLEAQYSGFDVMPELVEKAKAVMPEISFQVGSVLDNELVSANSFDTTFLVGVHSIFDTFEDSFRNLINWTKAGGKVYIFGLFNPYPVDVWLQYRLAGSTDATKEVGWNAFSLESVTRFLGALPEVTSVKFTEFKMPFDVGKNPDDVVRSWTFSTEGGEKRFTNGLSIIQHQYILELSIGPKIITTTANV